jgi:hypothetical protein
MSTEAEEREQATRRLKAKRELRQHLTAYVIVDLLLVVIWAITSPGGYFWPIWPIAGWGVGIGIHAWNTFGQRPITEADIQREIERGRGRTS